MFPDYESLVLGDYRRKMIANALSARLTHPTASKLKLECIAVLNSRYKKKDNKMLTDFFELTGEDEISDQLIQEFDTDKFKPLLNFLRNHTSTTDTKNVELLAWLINFEPRPYEFGRKYDQLNPKVLEFSIDQAQRNIDNIEVVNSEIQDNTAERKNIIPLNAKYGNPYSRAKTFVLIASIIILIPAIVLIVWSWNNKSSGKQLTGQEKCMYWAGDHYKQVSCSQKVDDAEVIAFDSVKFYGLKRIFNPDTITVNAIGKVWYCKMNGKLEYYTCGGYHPVYTQYRLKPITEYMINKHIKPG